MHAMDKEVFVGALWHPSCSLKHVHLEADMNMDLFVGILLMGFGLLVPILVLQPGRRRDFSAPRGDTVHRHS